MYCEFLNPLFGSATARLIQFLYLKSYAHIFLSSTGLSYFATLQCKNVPQCVQTQCSPNVYKYMISFSPYPMCVSTLFLSPPTQHM